MPKPITCCHGITPKKNCEICRKKYNREKARKWRKKNPERANEICRKAWHKNREKYIKRSREYYLKNRRRLLEAKRKYYGENKEKCQRKHKDYYWKNREKLLKQLREYNKRRYAELKAQARKLLGMKCEICGLSEDQTRINYHEIHGKKHPESGFYGYIYIIKHYKDFVCLCHWCHMTVHQLARNESKINQFLELTRKITAES